MRTTVTPRNANDNLRMFPSFYRSWTLLRTSRWRIMCGDKWANPMVTMQGFPNSAPVPHPALRRRFMQYLVSALISIWSHDCRFRLAHTDTPHFEQMDQEYLFSVPVQRCWTSGRCSDTTCKHKPTWYANHLRSHLCVGLRDSFWGSLAV